MGMLYDDYLEHFNPFHNPKNGQFASKSGSGTTISKRKQKKAYIEALNRTSDRMNNQEFPKLAAKKLPVDEHNKLALKIHDDIFREEYDRVISDYEKEIKNQKSITNKQVSNGKIILQGVLGASGAMAVAGITQYAAYKSGNEILGDVIAGMGGLMAVPAIWQTANRLVFNNKK